MNVIEKVGYCDLHQSVGTGESLIHLSFRSCGGLFMCIARVEMLNCFSELIAMYNFVCDLIVLVIRTGGVTCMVHDISRSINFVNYLVRFALDILF